MKQQQFEAQHAELWHEVARICEGKGTRERLPQAYRQLCQSLALARQRGYSPSLTDQLQALVLRAHRKIYGAAPARPLMLVNLMLREFPRSVRAEWRLLLCSLAAFWLVGIGVGLAVWFDPTLATSWMSPNELASYRAMYEPSHFSLGRHGHAGDVLMFGFYIANNVGICFRTFAGGLMGGVLALISVAFNGMHGGVLIAWLSHDPLTRVNILSYVVTHSSFETTGLILSGVAGMRLGMALLCPGRMRRGHALQMATRTAFPIIAGAAILTFVAAFFEAFWSASTSIPPSVKYAVGACCWLFVAGYLTLAGRQRAH